MYQVGAKSFIFFRTARPDATDPTTGEGYPDVIAFWVASGEISRAELVEVVQDAWLAAHRVE